MKKIAIIGSTGSIGVQTLNVIRRYPEKFQVVSLAAGKNAALFAEQVKEFRPKVAAIADGSGLQEDLSGYSEIFTGEQAFKNAIIGEANLVVCAVVGFKGIEVVLDAIEKGKDIALANKESLVVGGELVMRRAKAKGVSIFPVDSEHSAIWQALGFEFSRPFRRLILTASGGAFRDTPKERLEGVTAADALRHPNWKMGAKITVDCATMVNKAFEVTEARWLYGAPFDKIDVIIHRESVIHSIVEYEDGSMIAQMSYPTMELPIQIAIGYPERLAPAVKSLNFAEIGKLTFEELDESRYPAFSEVLSAVKKGGMYPAAANGANDTAVELFLKNKIGFNDINYAINSAVDAFGGYRGSSGCEDYESLCDAFGFAARHVKTLFGV